MKLKVTLITLLVAAAAFAVVQAKGSVDAVNSPKPQWFQSGQYLGSANKNPLSDTKNKLAYHLCGTKVYDFGSLGGAGAINNTTICEQSSSLTITGCAFNDVLTLGIDQAPVSAFGQFTPVMTAANTVAIVACGSGITDGGSFNMPDASYTVCCDGD